MTNLNNIINQPNKLLIENYFELQVEAEKKYGKSTIILIEVGSFYEIYSCPGIGKAQEVSQILNILLTRKNKSISEISMKNPNLCGIPSVSLDKHLERIINENIWTVIMVKQVGSAPNITRAIDRIISPGTNIDFLKNDTYNFIGSIYIEKTNKDILYGGLSLIDLSTGKILVYENFGNLEDKNIVIDEIYQLLNTYGCSEIVISGDGLDEKEKEKILSELNLKSISYTVKNDKDIKKSLNINYQNELLKKIFGSETFLSSIEELDMERYPNALNSLIILLDFIIEHDKKTVNKLLKPEIINSKQKLYIGNNALKQLNISEDNGLVKYVNKGITAIGRRYISEQLFNPLTDKNEIEKRYFLSKLFINNPVKQEVSILLKDFYDIERIWRKFLIGTINPFEVVNLLQSLNKILSVNSILTINDLTKERFNIDQKTQADMESMIEKIENSFMIEIMSVFSVVNINKNFIKHGISKEIELYQSQLNDSYKKIMGPIIGLERIFLNDSVEDILESLKENIVFESPREYKGTNVSVLFNDSEGFSVEITTKRYEANKEKIEDFFSKYFNGKYTTKKLKASIKFYFKEIETLSDEIVLLETKLINTCKKIFLNICNDLVQYESIINDVVIYVSQIDFYINNATLFEKFSYSVPEIIETDGTGFVEAIDIRHAIVERINDNELYIPNDIILGKKDYVSAEVNSSVIFQDDKDCVNGLLLYGLNSSGKSTLSKSLGISIIMAQSGFFVPAKSFRYALFESLFTRITGEDDIYNGKSTFAIELIDLKNIFNRANGKTLIIGDEPSKGTESISALAIVSSTIKHLSERNALFIFATHMHDLRTVNEVSEIESVVDVHLSVHYLEERDTLVYNRKLSPGSGSSIYGLEFAKYLKLNKDFLATAYDIRKRIATDLDPIEALSRNKRSTYNRGVFVQECAICGEQGSEIHHINEQQLANDNGNIDHFHKNHKANLVCLCEKHHDLVHKGLIIIEGIKQTSSGPELMFKDLS